MDQTFTEVYIAEQLSNFLLPMGYEALEGKKQLRRYQSSGFQNIIYSISTYTDSVWVEFHMGIRIDAVEQMAGKFTRTLPGWQQDAHTVVVSEGKLVGSPYLRRTAQNVHELDQIVAAFHSFWQTEGASFLNAHASVRGVDRLLNTAPDQKNKYLPNQAHRYIKGITAAKLAQNPHFAALAQQYLQAFDTLPNGHLWINEYRKLTAYLSGLSLN
ncbi:MAG: hypothetical protein AAFR59_08965, partial [Bacteroidota bacterium]